MKKVIQSIQDDVDLGYKNALEAYKILTEAEKQIKEAKANILEQAIDEYEKYGEKTIDYNGFKVSKTQSARYDYKHITQWADLKGQLTNVEELAKLAEKQGQTIILDSGELVDPAKKTYSKESLSFKAK